MLSTVKLLLRWRPRSGQASCCCFIEELLLFSRHSPSSCLFLIWSLTECDSAAWNFNVCVITVTNVTQLLHILVQAVLLPRAEMKSNFHRSSFPGKSTAAPFIEEHITYLEIWPHRSEWWCRPTWLKLSLKVILFKFIHSCSVRWYSTSLLKYLISGPYVFFSYYITNWRIRLTQILRCSHIYFLSDVCNLILIWNGVPIFLEWPKHLLHC